jgi:hypothetical protein
MNEIQDRMIKWFEWDHVPDDLKQICESFSRLADIVVQDIEPGPERTVALRKLLEAKDSAVRAKLFPGG